MRRGGEKGRKKNWKKESRGKGKKKGDREKS